MNILIADDERLARERLLDLLEDWTDAQVVGQAKNGIEAVEMAVELDAHVILMDIRMPGKDGLSAAMQLSELADPPAIIFTTAFSEFALEAFESNAIDYLLKPIKQERLFKALSACRKLNRTQLAVLHQHTSPLSNQYLSVQDRSGVQRIAINEVYYFLADHKYITVRHQAGESLLEDTLKHLQEAYAEDFIRIHRNALVRKTEIAAMHKQADGSMKLRLKNCSEQLDISQRMVPGIRKFLKQSMG